MSWLGLDIGGANLKAADGLGWARGEPFPLWRDPNGLAGALLALMQAAPAADRLVVTMTGELCDCFRTKAEGVRHILTAIDKAAAGRPVCVYRSDGRFVSMDQAANNPQLAAASNWHALASFACRFLDDASGLLIDIGSTTADIIPLAGGRPQTRGLSDTERLCVGELVYTGAGRTPICAVVPSFPWRGRICPVAAELFATTADAYVLLGDVPEQPDATWTADGRPLTIPFASERLGRMLCADKTEFTADDASIAAMHVRDRQLALLEEAALQATSSAANAPTTIVVSGSGEFLARRIADRVFSGQRVVSLTEQLGAIVSSCAPAHAVAALGREGEHHAFRRD